MTDGDINEVSARIGRLEEMGENAKVQREELLSEVRELRRRFDGQAASIAKAGAIVMILAGIIGYVFGGKMPAILSGALK